jgi:hypothetical protein
MAIRLEFTSRSPVRTRDYDAATHRYKTSYLDPSGYPLLVDAFPGMDLVDVIEPEVGGPRKPIKVFKLRVPDDTKSFRFSIRSANGSFSKSLTKPTTVMGAFNSSQPNNPWNWRLTVPAEGKYDIFVQTRNASGGGPTQSRSVNVRDFLVVSIGDSAASGQGNPDIPGTPKGFEPDLKWYDVFNPALVAYKLSKAAITKATNWLKINFTTLSRAAGAELEMDPEPFWLEPKAYRSLRSGVARAARKMEKPSEGRLVTFLSFARTGSEIDSGLIGPRSDGADAWIRNVGQVREVIDTVARRRIDALIITIGVNDVGVASTLKDMVLNDQFLFGGDDAAERAKAAAAARRRIAEIPRLLDQLVVALDPLNIRHIYLTEYPVGLFDRADGRPGAGCEIFSSDLFDADLSLEDSRTLTTLATELNDTLQREADRLGWFHVGGIAEGFRGHGYCTDDDRRFFVRATESLIQQGDTEGTIHPNSKGHAIYADRIAAEVIKHTLDRPRIVVPGPETIPDEGPTKVKESIPV